MPGTGDVGFCSTSDSLPLLAAPASGGRLTPPIGHSAFRLPGKHSNRSILPVRIPSNGFREHRAGARRDSLERSMGAPAQQGPSCQLPAAWVVEGDLDQPGHRLLVTSFGQRADGVHPHQVVLVFEATQQELLLGRADPAEPVQAQEPGRESVDSASSQAYDRGVPDTGIANDGVQVGEWSTEIEESTPCSAALLSCRSPSHVWGSS